MSLKVPFGPEFYDWKIFKRCAVIFHLKLLVDRTIAYLDYLILQLYEITDELLSIGLGISLGLCNCW